MDDTTHEAATDASHDPAQELSTDDSDTVEDVARAITWFGLGISTLTAIVALYMFYAHSTAAIANLAPPEHTSLFLAGFHLSVLLVAVAAVIVLVRRLASDDSP